MSDCLCFFVFTALILSYATDNVLAADDDADIDHQDLGRSADGGHYMRYQRNVIREGENLEEIYRTSREEIEFKRLSLMHLLRNVRKRRRALDQQDTNDVEPDPSASPGAAGSGIGPSPNPRSGSGPSGLGSKGRPLFSAAKIEALFSPKQTENSENDVETGSAMEVQNFELRNRGSKEKIQTSNPSTNDTATRTTNTPASVIRNATASPTPPPKKQLLIGYLAGTPFGGLGDNILTAVPSKSMFNSDSLYMDGPNAALPDIPYFNGPGAGRRSGGGGRLKRLAEPYPDPRPDPFAEPDPDAEPYPDGYPDAFPLERLHVVGTNKTILLKDLAIVFQANDIIGTSKNLQGK